jgi:hypothetical protein
MTTNKEKEGYGLKKGDAMTKAVKSKRAPLYKQEGSLLSG